MLHHCVKVVKWLKYLQMIFSLEGKMVSSKEYLSELLCRYRGNYDIEENFKLNNNFYPAYARFSSLSEKYVLRKEAKLWEIHTYEHILFIETKSVSIKMLDEIFLVMANEMEPEFVRNNQKYPEKNHMVSYLTVIIISEETPNEIVQKAIRHFYFDKGYMLNLRGHSEGHIACAALDSQKFFSNKRGARLEKFMLDSFNLRKSKKVS